MVHGYESPRDELEFYRKGILDLAQRGAEAVMTKGEYIGDLIVFFHLMYDTND